MSTAKSSRSVSYVEFSRFCTHSRVDTKYRGPTRVPTRVGSAVVPSAARRMLRAALIGFGSSGKTTLFQLMTSARETARAAHGKGETTVGISKVPDARLDRLTAMYNPKKRVPATVEFTDLAVTGTATKALVDAVAYKNADAPGHGLHALDDPAAP